VTSAAGPEREFGLERGKVFPASEARSLLNPLRRLVQSPSRTVAPLGLPQADRVLELGCGPGFFSPAIVAATKGAVVLFDVQHEMLRMATARAASWRTVAVQGDGAALPFAGDAFDVVFIATVLGEIPDRDGCLRDVRRVLRRGGTLAIAETRRDSDFVPIGALQPSVEPHGFVLRDRHGLRWQYVACFDAV